MPKMVFPGVRKYIDDANTATHHVSVEKLSRAKGILPVARAQMALEGVVEGPATTASRNAGIAEAAKWRDTLVVAADGIERAITAACTFYSLTPPTFSKPTNEV